MKVKCVWEHNGDEVFCMRPISLVHLQEVNLSVKLLGRCRLKFQLT